MKRFVRLYGATCGHGSAASLTDGWAAVLKERDMLAGTYPFKEVGYDEAGHNAPVAIVTDLKTMPVPLAGQHKVVYVVLDLHTAWMPDLMKGWLCDPAVHVLCSSQDTYNLFHQIMGQQACEAGVVPHGVAPLFTPLTESQQEALLKAPLTQQLRQAEVNLLHMCESSIVRKGTLELVQAFNLFQEYLAGVGPTYSLTIVSNGYESVTIHHAVSQVRASSSIRVLPRLNAAPDKLRWVYAAMDATIQPSRAEGFGLVPLEGLCMGTPAICTVHSGHAEWINPSWPGACFETVTDIACGDPGPPNFDGAMAPVVLPEAIFEALQRFDDSRKVMKQACQRKAQRLSEQWQWGRVLAPFLDGLQEKFA